MSESLSQSAGGTGRKLLVLSDDFPPEAFGGAGIVAHSLSSGLAKRGYRVVVVTTVRDKAKAGVSTEGQLKIYRLHSDYHERYRAWRSLNNGPVVAELEGVLEAEKPDVVHAHNVHYHLSYQALVLSRRYTEKIFMTAHDVMSFNYGKYYPEVDGSFRKLSPLTQLKHYKLRYNPLRNSRIKDALRNVSAIMSVSEALSSALKVHNISDTVDIKVVHNGIDVDFWQKGKAKREELRQMYGLGEEKVMLFSGRLSKAKGAHVMVRALKTVVDKGIDASVLVVGSKEDKSIEGLASRLGVADRLHVTGWLDREDMPAVYAASDLTLCLSQYLDPFPTVNLEAMAVGKAVLGTTFGGTKEAVVDKETGIIVDPRNVSDVARGMEVLLTNDSARNMYAKAAQDRVVAQFKMDTQLDEIIDTYNE